MNELKHSITEPVSAEERNEGRSLISSDGSQREVDGGRLFQIVGATPEMVAHRQL